MVVADIKMQFKYTLLAVADAIIQLLILIVYYVGRC